MTIREIFEAYEEACLDAHYNDEQFNFDPASFDWEYLEEVQ